MGDGACLIAELEKEAVEIVASVFGLREADLTGAPDKTVDLPLGVILEASGKTKTIKGG